MPPRKTRTPPRGRAVDVTSHRDRGSRQDQFVVRGSDSRRRARGRQLTLEQCNAILRDPPLATFSSNATSQVMETMDQLLEEERLAGSGDVGRDPRAQQPVVDAIDAMGNARRAAANAPQPVDDEKATEDTRKKKSCAKRSRAVCEGTDSSSALSLDTDAILADIITTFRKIPPASGVHSIGSFYGPFVSRFAHTVICVYRNEDTSLPSKKKRKKGKASPPLTGKLYRYTFCFGEPHLDADLCALESDVRSNAIAWIHFLAPPIVTGQSTRSPDIALTEDNFVKEWTLWQLIQSRDKGEIGRVLRVGGNNGLVFSVKITSWMRSTFQKNFSRKSQSSDSKRYLVFADENNTKYPRSILLLQNNWVLQIECNANCENGTIADMFKGFGIEKLGICFGWSFSSNTDVDLFLYAGDKNEASTKAVLKRCRLKLFRVPVAVPGFECLPMDETVILSVTNTDFVEETPLSKPTVEASTSALSLEASQSLALRSANFEGTESAAMGDTLILSDTETPEVGEEHSFSENEPLSMPLVESSTSGFSPLAIVPSTETQAASGSMSVDYALLYYALKDKYNTLLSLYNAHVPMEMTMELPMDVSATDTSASTELSSEFGPAVSDESTDPFSIDALNKGAEE